MRPVTLSNALGEATGPINFTMFLTMFGEKLNGTDPEDVMRCAFQVIFHRMRTKLSVLG